MRTTLSPEMEKGRIAGPPHCGPFGMFEVLCTAGEILMGRTLRIIAADGRDDPESVAYLKKHCHVTEETIAAAFAWEHVSVSARSSIPNWAEMCWVKDQFWPEDETVVQFHVPSTDHINIHARCLHLWRPIPGRVDAGPHIETPDGGMSFTFESLPLPPHMLVGPKPTDIKTSLQEMHRDARKPAAEG